MKDEQTKLKEEKLIQLVSSFFEEYLDEEYEKLSIKLVKKLGRKHNIPFKRGKLENWASGVIYAISQINFLFDDKAIISTSPDEICNFYNTKKSTASNKAREIRKMLKLSHFDEEFSSERILRQVPQFFIDERTGMIIMFESSSEEYNDEEDMDLDEISKEFKLLDEWIKNQ